MKAGWYPDNRIQGVDRYFDGEEWTTQIRHHEKQTLLERVLRPRRAPSPPSPSPVEPAERSLPVSPQFYKAPAVDDPQSRIVCQFCQQAGSVKTWMFKSKNGISGGKATGAILTGGVSLLATGLAKKGWVTALSCGNCGMRWEVAS